MGRGGNRSRNKYINKGRGSDRVESEIGVGFEGGRNRVWEG